MHYFGILLHLQSGSTGGKIKSACFCSGSQAAKTDEKLFPKEPVNFGMWKWLQIKLPTF